MRWRVLVLLFMVRAVMAFQFGSVGALGPAIGEAFRADAAAVGLLVGLYLSPGLLFALPGGAIARTFGDKRVVFAGVALMVLGGMVSAITTHWEA
jgi:MFS family permease